MHHADSGAQTDHVGHETSVEVDPGLSRVMPITSCQEKKIISSRSSARPVNRKKIASRYKERDNLKQKIMFELDTALV